MNKEYLEVKDKVLIVSVDLGNGKDCQNAVLNLYYNETNHIIFETNDKEQVAVLNEIMKEEMKKKTVLQKAQEDKVIADFIREHYKLSNDINKNYLELKKPITMEEDNKFKEVL